MLPIPEPLVHSSASAVAEMASCLVLAPAELIKQNAQMLQGRRQLTGSTSLTAFRQLTGTGAGRRLFTGYMALVARNLPFTALQFPIFEKLRAMLKQSRDERKGHHVPHGLLETGMISGASAAGAGAFAAFLTTPSDVVKTRMMLTSGDNNGPIPREGDVERTQQPKQGAWKVTKRVYQERGVRGLFRGGLFRSAWTALGSGLYLGTYDVAKVWLKRTKPGFDDSVGL